MTLLAAIDVSLERDGERFDLSCRQYVGARHPEGYRRCVSFARVPFPEWRFEVPGGALTARIFMPHDLRCAVCVWALDAGSSPGPWTLRVRPLLAYRDIDSLTRANDDVDMSLRGAGGTFSVAPYSGCPEMFFHCGNASVRPTRDWYFRFLHPWDIALGRDGEEDLFSPCEMTWQLAPGESVALAAGMDRETDGIVALEERERRRREALSLPGLDDDPCGRVLAQAADAFVWHSAVGEVRIVASYPDASADLRAALVAFPGLLLATRRLEEARAFVSSALRRLSARSGDAAMDDAPLWFVRAGELYVDHSRDWDFLRDELTPGCVALLRRYTDNESDSGFRMAPDALLCSARPSEAPTWMDARVDGRPLTPRAGKPVEVNALWHHALSLAARWLRRGEGSDQVQRFSRLRDLCARSFRHRFWNESESCLYDVVDPVGGPQGSGADLSFRPNQLLAVALPSDLLDRRQATGVLSFVEKRLLTPHGLRSLSLEDRAFRPTFGGNAMERAAARHQGAVFPWLMGAYIDAVFRVYGRTARAYAQAETCIEALLTDHLRDACVGQVSELFNGAAPHAPRGAFAHAPATAELLRSYVEVKATRW